MPTFQSHVVIQPYLSKNHRKDGDFQWVKRDARIENSQGEVVFEQKDVQFPDFYSQTAVNVVASKYFRLINGKRESSLADMIARIVNTITQWGEADGYFQDTLNSSAFKNELTHTLICQYACFNSPVLFNIGVPGSSNQASACFLLTVDDSMESIMNWIREESIIFKGGSGSGVNVSKIRGKDEPLSLGGKASGALSFMKVADASSGVIKSGGTCLPGHQAVFTETGPVPVEKLAERGDDGFYVLSYDPPSHRIKVKKAWAWHAGRKPVYRITTDKGIFELSYDHPVRLADGISLQTKQLKPGMRLHKCSVDERNGYTRIGLQDGKSNKEFFHRMLLKDALHVDIDGYIVHHRNGCKWDNTPENLHVGTQEDHASYHMKKLVRKGEHVFQLYSFDHGGTNNGMHHDGNFWQDEVKSSKLRKQHSTEMKQRGKRAMCRMQSQAATQRMINMAWRIINGGGNIDSFENYHTSRVRICGGTGITKAALKKRIDTRFGSYDAFIEAVNEANHRVISVERIGTMDVYDVEVDCPTPDDKSPQSGHNFAIWPDGAGITGQGIFVHNTRRSAKLVCMDVDHPDILDFIWCKVKEEAKARALVQMGYDDAIDGEAYSTVAFQNTNHSVRVTDEFMQAVENERVWVLKRRIPANGGTSFVKEYIMSHRIFHEIAEAAWQCADPGIIFADTTNSWHTCANTDSINTTNPCQPGYATVLTPEGIRTFDDIDVGSTIWSGSSWTKILRKKYTGKKKVYEYKTSAGTFIGTKEHRVVSNGKKIEVQNADVIDVASGPEAWTCTLDEEYNAQAIVDGLVIGDGSVKKATEKNRNHYMLLCVGRNDMDYFCEGEPVADFINSSPFDRHFHRVKTTIEPHELGRTYEREIPERYFYGDAREKCSFLRGLFSANGSVVGTRVTLKAASYAIIAQTQEMLSSLGMRSYVTTNKSHDVTFKNGTYTCRESYDLNISTDRKMFASCIGFIQRHKQQRLQDICNDTVSKNGVKSSPVQSCRYLGRSDVYDITVDCEEHTYWTGGLLVSNCGEFVFLDNTACFAPETRISTPYGLRTIEDLYLSQSNGEEIIISTDIHSENDPRSLLSHRKAVVTKVGEKPVVKMTLKDGRSIRVTSDHRFLTTNGWKRVDELEIGVDRIRLRENGDAPVYASSDAELLRWQMLGWLTGDGVFSQDVVALTYGPDDADTAQLFEPEFNRLIKDSVSLGYAYSEVRECHTGVQRNGVLQISSQARSVVQYLEEKYGISQGTALYKDVPKSIYSAPNDLRIAYLQGLFSSDGCVRTSDCAQEKEIMLASSSPSLLRSVQLLLGDLGIVSRINWFYPDGRKNAQGQLHITNRQMRKFVALIGMSLSHKKHIACQAIYNSTFLGAQKNPRSPFVAAIENDGIETVYDITEPVTHSVIAEGMIAHNCNLASINLLKFLKEDGTFDIDAFKHVVDVMITAQEILVGRASYPTEAIEKNSHDYRPLGLGYANLGALLMAKGMPYDSDEGRDYAASITALMTGEAYAQSARIAAVKGPFAGFEVNKEPMMSVIQKHYSALVPDIQFDNLIWYRAMDVWGEAQRMGQQYGYRNAQVSLLAPTGTISIMMDCQTTGVEPDVALVNYKKLVGGGTIKHVNTAVPQALRTLGYDEKTIRENCAYLERHGSFDGIADMQLRKEHRAVFDCAFPTISEGRSIHWAGHVEMVAALQPFLSGSISKTVNLPNEATVEDIKNAYMMAWKLGCKSIAIYRDGCKQTQVLTTQNPDSVESTSLTSLTLDLDEGLVTSAQDAVTIHEIQGDLSVYPRSENNVIFPINERVSFTPPVGVEQSPLRKRLPDERHAITHKFSVGGAEGYLTVGLYENGKPGELFIRMSKEGSTLSGWSDAFATMVSIALQYGVPLEVICTKFRHMRFEPSGFTPNKNIPLASSVLDYICHWLELRFPEQPSSPNKNNDVSKKEVAEKTQSVSLESVGAAGILGVPMGGETVNNYPCIDYNSNPCPNCGSTLFRNGSCHYCAQCGYQNGCVG